MKLISTLILLLSTLSALNAQSVTAEFYSGNQASHSSEFPLFEGLLTSSGDTYLFGIDNQVTLTNPVSFSVSNGLKMVGAIQFAQGITTNIFNYRGRQLISSALEYADPSDETLQLTTLDTGEFILRDNVANFSFFTASGERSFTYSNSAETAGGELPSEISVSTDGVLKVAYNPVIQFQNNRGSRISIITGDREADEIFYSRNRVINRLRVLSDDHTLSVITEDSGGSKKMHLFDRFGNLLFEMEPDLDVTNFNVSDGGEFITLYAGNRVQVYRTATSERLGSATSRSRIVQAAYFPEDNLILTLGGRDRGQQIESPEITAINIQKRQIERTELNGTISLMDSSEITIRKTGVSNYRIEGINRPIQVTAQF